MRAIAIINSHPEYKRVMLYKTSEGVYLFLYQSEKDSSCQHDLWFESIEKAVEYGTVCFGVASNQWQQIADPLPGCRDDYIQPIPIKRIGAE